MKANEPCWDTSQNVERSWRTDVEHIDTCVIISAGLIRCSVCRQLHTMRLHACAVRPLSHRTSVKKQRIVSHEECTRFHAKNYASVRFCRRSRPTTKFLNVCKNFARNVGHVKHYCPFSHEAHFVIFRKHWENFARNVFFFVWKGLKCPLLYYSWIAGPFCCVQRV